MYFRHGVYTSRKLNYGDYLEARNQIWALSNTASHGTRNQRLAAFDWGFNSAPHYTNCTNRPSW
jgi:hypothetical protein